MTDKKPRGRLWGKVAATAAVAVLAAVLTTAPAQAWSSSATNSSPSGCSGGFAGSSSKYYSSSAGYEMMYASISRYGSSCNIFTSTPVIYAWYRATANTTTVACSSFSTFCAKEVVFRNGFAGGIHEWGSVSFNT